jgi:hypothetical protein
MQNLFSSTSTQDTELTGQMDNQSPEPAKGRALSGLLRRRILAALVVAAATINPASAEASIFKGEMLDKVSDILSWVVLIIAPIIGIVVFWLVHILPEKIAEKKHHPQAKAIQTLCLLSLVFGGLLWPLAWLWAYTKPVLYQMAYGTDKAVPDHGNDEQPPSESFLTEELELQRNKVAELEGKLATIKGVTE